MLRQASHELTISTRGRGLYEFTREIEKWIVQVKGSEGLLTLHLRHTSASLLIQENADPDVRRDLESFFKRLVPDGDPLFIHDAEGDDDMPAHIRTALTTVNLSIPVHDGRLTLGDVAGDLFVGNTAPMAMRVASRCISSANKLANNNVDGSFQCHICRLSNLRVRAVFAAVIFNFANFVHGATRTNGFGFTARRFSPIDDQIGLLRSADLDGERPERSGGCQQSALENQFALQPDGQNEFSRRYQTAAQNSNLMNCRRMRVFA